MSQEQRKQTGHHEFERDESARRSRSGCWQSVGLYAMKNKQVQQKQAKSPQALRNLRRQRATKANLAKDLSTKEAMLAAGYSPLYVQHQGYKAIKRPCIQSVFTESCERIMAKRQIQFDEIMEPIFDALKAKVIVKSTQLGDAQEVDLPDYPLRMSAADRLIELYGGTLEHKETEKPTAPPLGLYAWESLPLEERLLLRAEVAAVIQRRLQAQKPPIIVSGNGHGGNGSTT
jgi:hypothetical protein